MPITQQQQLQVVAIARQAGKAIMAIYDHEDVGIQSKQDGSPITLADRAAHQLIVDQLTSLFDWPVLSEENDDLSFETRANWPTLWVVDPLDGTKEFINRNGEFTVNIALVVNGEPSWGCIVIAATNEAYFGGKELGAWHLAGDQQVCEHRFDAKPIACSGVAQPLRVATTRSHANQALGQFITTLKQQSSVTSTPLGSSLKFCALASGRCDLYPRFSPTSEWDTAAGQALLEGAGGQLVDFDGKPYRYNQRHTLLNGNFLAMGKVTDAQKNSWIELAKR